MGTCCECIICNGTFWHGGVGSLVSKSVFITRFILYGRKIEADESD